VELLQLVRARRERWRVADIRVYGSCRLLTLRSAEPGAHGVTRRLLTPFDEVEAMARRDRPRRVGARLWRRAARALVAADTPPGALRTAARANLDLLPHQLEPALAVLRGAGTRVLLADDVGLGKTIQAGLILSELLARVVVDRALVITPAGVRDQWAGELSARLGIDVALADARALRQRAAALPMGVNPWSTLPIAIASIDYVKRPEVLPAVQACRWDVLVVDEAHATAGDSERHAAIQAIASRCPYVLLLTATPHNGDERAFAALRDLGQVAADGDRDPLLVFRRTRRQIRGDAVRRTHTLAVRPTLLEERLHAALASYRHAVREEHGERALALSVLDKRAFSSPWSLAQSVQRRLQAIAEPATSGQAQLPLPLDEGDGEATTDDEPPPWPAGLELSDVGRERRLLGAVLGAALAAVAGGESKVGALRRLVRRARQPIVVFTEYRDTALHLTAAFDGAPAVLHGGLSREQRTAVVDRFARGLDSLLVATDAAGQGLNLHYACRIVVNLELPWNPMRLEQRIGRVDRIGQRRPVHAFHLVAAGTGEARILSRLKERIETARAAVDAPDPFGSSEASVNANPVSTAAGHEGARLAAARACALASDDLTRDHLECSRPWIVRARRWKLRTSLAGRTLLVYRVVSEDAAGRTVESRLVPLTIDGVRGDPAGWPGVPDALRRQWDETVGAVANPFWTTRIAREQAIAEAQAAGERALVQGTLFDRQAERAHADRLARLADAQLDEAALRTDLTERAAISSRPPELLLVVVP
jgi:superfamily II DNA or RNA helicase